MLLKTGSGSTAVGCDRCGNSGYRGRLGIYELMILIEEIRELILRRMPTDEISRVAKGQGMVRLRTTVC